MNRNLILSSAALLALAACGDAQKATNEAETAATDTASEVGTAVENTTAAAADAVTPSADTSTPAGYAMAAAMGDLFEIESSKLALQKAKSPEVKSFAQMMVDGHSKTTNDLKTTLASAGVQVTPPTTLDEKHQSMLNDLQQAAAADFDTAYLDAQTKAHSESLDIHRGYAENGDNAPLKAFAAKTAPIVQQHLDQVKKLDTSGADEPAANPPQ